MGIAELAPTTTFDRQTAENWEQFDHGRMLFSRVLIVPEEIGGFSVFAADLPGASSQGETVEESLANITEVITELVKYYRDQRSDIPWGEAQVETTPSTEERWVLVNG